MLVGSQLTISAQTTVYGSQLGPITTALKADPNNPNAAKDQVKAYVKAFKKNPEALVALGNAYFTAKQYDKAIFYADMALKKNKNFGDAYVLKGDVEALKDDGGEAAMWYQQSMTLDPTNPNGYTRYASIYRKRDPKTVEATMEALKKNVPSYPAEAELGHMFWSTDLRKSYEYYQKTNPNTIGVSGISITSVSLSSAGEFCEKLSFISRRKSVYIFSYTAGQFKSVRRSCIALVSDEADRRIPDNFGNNNRSSKRISSSHKPYNPQGASDFRLLRPFS